MKSGGIHVSFLPENEDGDGVDPREADAVLTRWIADYTDPDAFTYAWLHTQKGHRGLLCGTREIDAHIERARLERVPRFVVRSTMRSRS